MHTNDLYDIFVACQSDSDARHCGEHNGWQRTGSTGGDAQPWFPIFNPLTQSEKTRSATALYQSFLPGTGERAREGIHAPWRAAPDDLKN
ncbi:FAD-binding domain-containing protein [Paraburkholderia diazotrophica]|uniref:FAD-binding domain-containing protein n=1 Tax=Paraburkholderia diazotrophica TaxID=667676 RepID=UPI003173FDE0